MRLLFFAFISVLVSSAYAKTYKVHYMENPPYTFTDKDGKPAGIFPIVMKKMIEKAGHKVEFTGHTTIARSEEMMKTGESDMAGGVAFSKERAEFLDFAPMVAKVDYTFFGKKGEPAKYKKVEDLKGKRVAVHISSALGRDLERIKKDILGGDLNIEAEISSDLPMKKLAGNRYPEGTLIYTIKPIGVYFVKQEKVDIEYVDFSPFQQSSGVVFSKKSVPADEQKALKAALAEVMRSDEIKKLFAGYEVNIHPESK